MANGYFVGANGKQRKRPATPVAELFAARVEKIDATSERSDKGCWRWKGTIDKDGYGKLKVRGRPHVASRISWELHRGPIPPGMQVLHTCDVATGVLSRSCVSPEHLFLGTATDNMTDRDQKGRQAKGEGHGISKLTDAQVQEIRALRAEYLKANPTHTKWKNAAGASGTYRDLAARFRVSEATVQFVCRRKHWRHLP